MWTTFMQYAKTTATKQNIALLDGMESYATMYIQKHYILWLKILYTTICSTMCSTLQGVRALYIAKTCLRYSVHLVQISRASPKLAHCLRARAGSYCPVPIIGTFFISPRLVYVSVLTRTKRANLDGK